MLGKAVESGLIAKNAAKQINTVITKEGKKKDGYCLRKKRKYFLWKLNIHFIIICLLLRWKQE